MEIARILFIVLIPIVATLLTLSCTKEDDFGTKIKKGFGIVISSMPIIGIILGYSVKKKSPEFAQACFTQAIVCGLGFVVLKEVLPNFL